MPTIRQVQKALNLAGAKPPIAEDNDLGRATIAAIAAFQKAKGLDVKYPGTIGPKTLAALGFDAGDKLVIERAFSIGTAPVAAPPWLIEARRRLGLHEIRDNKTLREYLKSNGGSIGDPAKVPWCGDFVETVIAKTLPHEPLPSNPYWALNWSKFGRALKAPAMGAIATFKRDGGGHVAFVIGQDATYFHVLGGNQSNAVTITKIAKARLDALRWPATYDMPRGALALTTLNATISRNEA